MCACVSNVDSQCISMDCVLWVWLQVYQERVLTVAVNCAREAARANVKKFIHFSTAQIYDSSKVRGEGRVCVGDC